MEPEKYYGGREGWEKRFIEDQENQGDFGTAVIDKMRENPEALALG